MITWDTYTIADGLTSYRFAKQLINHTDSIIYVGFCKRWDEVSRMASSAHLYGALNELIASCRRLDDRVNWGMSRSLYLWMGRDWQRQQARIWALEYKLEPDIYLELLAERLRDDARDEEAAILQEV